MISQTGKSNAGIIVMATALLIAGCDSASVDQDASVSTESGTSELASTLMTDVGLTTDQHQQVMRFIGNDDNAWKEPGFTWRLAAQLQSTLTEEQKQRLVERSTNLPSRGHLGQSGPVAEGFGSRRGRPVGDDGQRTGHFGPHFRGGGLLADILTEEQKTQADEIHSSYREQIQALRDQLSNGELTREEGRGRIGELRDAMRADLEALLTDEQRSQLEALRQARIEEREARREAARDIRNEVLGLDTEGAASLDAILDEFREAVRGLREDLSASEADRDEIHAGVQALIESRDAEVAALLDEVGFEVFRIHESLQHRLRRHQVDGAAHGGIGRRVPGDMPFGRFGNRG